MKRTLLIALVLLCALAGTASAQQTGIITGRVVDAQGSAVPGVTVTATQAATGLVRSVVSDGEGIYRLNGMPVGSFDLKAEITGFAPWERKGIIVNVAQTTDLNIDLKLAGMSEAVNVTAESPLVATSPSVTCWAWVPSFSCHASIV